jgi:glycosyltransferase involved in cell wall biosynthesis
MDASSDTPRLSIVVPVYNEAATIREVLRRIVGAPFAKEILVVDDGSFDGTTTILRDLDVLKVSLSKASPSASFDLKVFFHDRNRGKGAAIRTALGAVTGDIVLIQDADLEYDPTEYPSLVRPILEGKADVVYGSRFLGFPRRVLFFWHSIGNKFLTLLSNVLTNLNLTDMETGYKVFRSDLIKNIKLNSNRFGFEPEVTAKLAKLGARIYEVPISYSGRTYWEGKKINWRDGIAAIWAILKYAVLDDNSADIMGLRTLKRMKRLSRYNAWIFEEIRSKVGNRILEVGSGIGNMTQYFVNRELVVVSDIEDRYLQYLRGVFERHRNIQVHRIDLESQDLLKFEMFDFDTIICLNVLEHVKRDDLVLQNFWTILKEGGHLILLVPAMKVLYGSIDRYLSHYRRYEFHELTEMVQRAGFHVESVRYLNLLGSLGWFINGRLLQRKSVPGIQSRLFDCLTPYLRFEQEFNLPFGLSLIAISRK